MNPTRPIFRYYGGKWQISPWIVSFFPGHTTYCEPYGGGASVLMRKPRSYGEIYNDLDGAVVNVFRVLRDHGEELRRRLELSPFSREEFELAYGTSGDEIENARRAVCLSFMGFGADSLTRGSKNGFRANTNRRGTTPATDWSRYPEVIPSFIERLRGVVIEKKDAKDVMAVCDKASTLFYIDPPYLIDTRSSPRKGYRYEMTNHQHEDLLAYSLRLKGMVVISGYRSRMHDDYLKGWFRYEKNVKVFGNKRRVESIWLNPAAYDASPQKEMRL